MARRPKRATTPCTRCHGTWTEAAFWGFIRSALRSASTRWYPKVVAKQASRRPYEGPNKRRKWEYQCAICGNYYEDKEVDLDHIVPAGELRCAEDLPGFVTRLFCEANGYQVVCHECHRQLTGKQRHRARMSAKKAMEKQADLFSDMSAN